MAVGKYKKDEIVTNIPILKYFKEEDIGKVPKISDDTTDKSKYTIPKVIDSKTCKEDINKSEKIISTNNFVLFLKLIETIIPILIIKDRQLIINISQKKD
ncbi:hypothetical protein C4S76_09690 [Apibacter adventoris]|nr:hypothetical protein C4S76_09690 [Apibacter adventoris]